MSTFCSIHRYLYMSFLSFSFFSSCFNFSKASKFWRGGNVWPGLSFFLWGTDDLDFCRNSSLRCFSVMTLIQCHSVTRYKTEWRISHDPGSNWKISLDGWVAVSSSSSWVMIFPYKVKLKSIKNSDDQEPWHSADVCGAVLMQHHWLICWLSHTELNGAIAMMTLLLTMRRNY